MLKLTKITGDEFYVNPETIKSVENKGDTILTLTTGERILIKEKAENIQKQFVLYKREVHGTSPLSKI